MLVHRDRGQERLEDCIYYLIFLDGHGQAAITND